MDTQKLITPAEKLPGKYRLFGQNIKSDNPLIVISCYTSEQRDETPQIKTC